MMNTQVEHADEVDLILEVTAAAVKTTDLHGAAKR